MEKYEQLSVVGEGSYGLVLKCRHRDTDQVVAIKKFLETEEDATVRRMALREIRMLKKLKHENLVTMIEVFRHRKRFYLVFEYLEGTILDELEKMPGGLGQDRCRERIYQVARAVNYCHSNYIIHRDVKPENVLVSSMGVVKLCDFGFARILSTGNEPCTEYVATRWYRAPELLVGEDRYGAPVDIWAIGCLFAEMMTGDPLFPGESDIDQLYLIVKMIGKPCSNHVQLMTKNSQLRSMLRSTSSESNGLYKTFADWSLLSLDFLVACTRMDPQSRPTSDELLKHEFFTHDRFPQRFLPILREKITQELSTNPLLRRYKAEILMAGDWKEECKLRRSSQTDSTRWKINLVEGSIKRKFSCETINSESNSEKSIISLLRSNQKLNVNQKSSQNFMKSSSIIKEKTKRIPSSPKLNQSDSSKQFEVQKLDKSLQNIRSLNRLPQKSENIRPSSSIKTNKSDSPLSHTPSSPQFQSLQPSFGEFNQNKSPQSQSILHPSINNITFAKDPPKKSPNILQSLSVASVKSTFNQVPLLNPPRNTQQFLKKLERNIVLDTMQTTNCPSWFTSVGNTNVKRRDKPKIDDFTLPNLPGATSPYKNRKKYSPENHTLPTSNVTPRIQSSTSQKSASSKVLQNLPFM